MDATRDRAAMGVGLADQAGQVILQIRDGAGNAIRAVSIFANERNALSTTASMPGRAVAIVTASPDALQRTT